MPAWRPRSGAPQAPTGAAAGSVAAAMAYFLTGATGFIGRHLVERLLDREGDIYVLVREGSTEKLEALIDRWGTEAREPRQAGDRRPRPRLGLGRDR